MTRLSHVTLDPERAFGVLTLLTQGSLAPERKSLLSADQKKSLFVDWLSSTIHSRLHFLAVSFVAWFLGTPA